MGNPNTVSVLYPEGLDSEFYASFSTHNGTRIHLLSVGEGTQVDFYEETATTTFGLAIQDGSKPTEHLKLEETAELVRSSDDDESIWVADFTNLGDAKDVAVEVLANRVEVLRNEAEKTTELLERERKLKKRLFFALGSSATIATLTAEITNTVSLNSLKLLTFSGVIVSLIGFTGSALSLVGTSLRFSTAKKELNSNRSESRYLQESVDALIGESSKENDVPIPEA